MAGCDHLGVRVHATTGDDREDSAVSIAADLEIVFVHEGVRPETQACEVISGFRAAGLVQFRRVHEHEPDSEIAFDVERVSVDDSGHVPFDT